MDYSNNGNKRNKRKLSPHSTRVKNKIGLLLFRVFVAVVLVGGFAAVGVGLGLYMGIIANTPVLNMDHLKPTNYTTFIYDNAGREMDRLSGEQNRVYVSFDRIPQDLKNAFIAIEDERFYSHNGIDARGIARALYELVRTAGGRTQGASTITQQLIKNKLDRFDSDLTTKLQEQWLAIQFERKLAEPENFGSKQAAKDYILEIYLNEINLGRGCYGVQAAAWHYYGKDVSELTLAECATIAAITQNPTRLPPDIRQENNWRRTQLVLENMLRLELITEQEYRMAKTTRVYDGIVQGANLNTDGLGEVRSYFVDQIITEVYRDLREKFNLTHNEAYNWIYTRGLQIHSTQDTAMQNIVDAHMLDPENFSSRDFEIDVEFRVSVKNNITNRITNHEKKRTVKTWENADAFIEQTRNELLTANDEIINEQIIMVPQPQACFVVMDQYNGHVKALSGGRGEKPVNRSFNRATEATRSPGSQFKVLAAYAPAMDIGRMTPATVIDDAPFIYDDGFLPEPWSPGNWWGSTYEGLASVRRGIYRSMNVLAAKTTVMVGIDICFMYLQNFGFTTLVDAEWQEIGGGRSRMLTDKGPSLPLGGLTHGVKQAELCAAYAAIANLGTYNRPIYYTRVLDHDGRVILENRPEPRRVMRETTAYLLTDMMKDTMTATGGTGSRFRFQEVRMPIAGKTGTSSNTNDLGFTGYTPYYTATVWKGFDQQKRIMDENSHRDLWRKIMEEIHRNLPEKQFDQPGGITRATVCRDSGKLPTEMCSRDPRGGRTVTELFAQGSQPQDYCDDHIQLRICTLSGQRCGAACPEWDFRVGVALPDRPENASYLDGEYVFTASVLFGPECYIHSGGGWPGNIPGAIPGALPGAEATPIPNLGDLDWGWGVPGVPGQTATPAPANINEWPGFQPFAPTPDPWNFYNPDGFNVPPAGGDG